MVNCAGTGLHSGIPGWAVPGSRKMTGSTVQLDRIAEPDFREDMGAEDPKNDG
jgi:hypothetical protein